MEVGHKLSWFHLITHYGKKQMKVSMYSQVSKVSFDPTTPISFDVDLQHSQLYNISIRARNRLGESRDASSISVQTKNVPIEQEGMF